jgi:hypothetical protein
MTLDFALPCLEFFFLERNSPIETHKKDSPLVAYPTLGDHVYNKLGFKLCQNWFIDYLVFYVPLKNVSLIWRRHHCRWRATKFRPMLGAQGLWAGMDLYRVTPTVTWGLGFSGLIRRTSPISRLLQQAWGCGESILTQILTGQLCQEAFM